MSWFRSHLNWTIILFIVVTFIVLVIIALIQNTTDSTLLNIMAVIISIVSFFVFGWVLRRKNRRMWWLLLNFVSIGWIVFIALENKSLRYDVADHEKVLNIIKLWPHTLKSIELATEPLRQKTTQQNSSIPTEEEFRASLSDALAKIEVMRGQSIDEFQWPSLTDSEASYMVFEMKKYMAEFFTLEYEGMRLMGAATVFVDGVPRLMKQVDKELGKITKTLKRSGKQMWDLTYRLAKRYGIPYQEYEQLIESA